MSAGNWKTWTSNGTGPMPPGAGGLLDGSSEVSSHVRTDVGTLLDRLGISQAYGVNTCSVCKEEREIVLKYQPFKITRLICEVCCAKVVGKFLGLNNNAEFEETLFGGER